MTGKTVFRVLFALLLSTCLHAQRGKNGNYTVTAASVQINAYTALTVNAAVNATSLTVTSSSLTSSVLTTALAPGDLIMIIQMQGATLDINTTPAAPPASGGWGGNYTISNGAMADLGNMNNYRDEWGQITAYNNAGKYELVEVRAVPNATTITLMCGLRNAYTASGHVQVIRVPRFADLTVNTGCSVVAYGWDGTVGGVVALEVNGNLALNGTGRISASGLGFRGGALDATGLGPATNASDIGKPGYSAIGEGAEKGEGIGGYATAEYTTLYSRYGMGAPANGGGGGNYRNAGGGGGANIGSGTYTGYGVPNTTYAANWNLELAGMSAAPSSGGGRGGYSLSTSNQNEATLGPNQAAWGGDFRRAEGGLGGHPLAYDATRLFMGGGGGSGEQDGTQGGAGGRGGGIVHITVYGTTSGTGTIEANGANGQNSNSAGLVAPAISSTKYGNDGAGGGGAGGYIAISNGVALPASITLSATGGAGGNQVLSFGNFAGVEASGPGGGGAGGGIAFASGTPTQNAAGGLSGTTNSAHVNAFPPNGATGGANGVTSLPFGFYDIVATDVTICPNTSTTLTANVLGTLPVGATLTWYTTQFGMTTLGTGTSYTTPVLSATTTYYIGTCPGTFREAVTVTVGGGASISGTLTIPVGGTTNLTGTGTAAAVNPWVSGTPAVGTVNSTGVVTGVSVGTTTITYTNSSGCLATVVVNVVAPLPVDLLFFDARLTASRKVELNWETQSEQQNDHFIVQRSNDFEHWEDIVTIEGSGNSDALNAYNAYDPAPFTGTNYYRLKQVDTDGMFRLSDVRTITLSEEGDLAVYPNPTTVSCHIVGEGIADDQIVVFNQTGQLVTCDLLAIDKNHVELVTTHLPSGVYHIRVLRNNSQQVYKLSVVR